MMIQNTSANAVTFDQLSEAYTSKPVSAGMSALKGSMGNHEMVHQDLQEMMKDLTPHLGQNVDVEA